MYIDEYTMLLILKREREEIMRKGEVMRALRSSQELPSPVRIHLGMVLVRLGRWIMGQPSSALPARIELGREES